MSSYADNLEAATRFAQELQEVQEQIRVADNNLAELKEREKEISESRLPELLDELGFTDLRLANGRRVELTTKIFASIPTESGISRMKSMTDQQAAMARRRLALDWLRKNDLGDLIKNEVAINFSRGEEKHALELTKELNGRGIPANMESTVNTQTLSAQIKELMANGEDVPFDILGIAVTRTVRIK